MFAWKGRSPYPLLQRSPHQMSLFQGSPQSIQTSKSFKVTDWFLSLTIMLHKPVGYICSRKKENQSDGRPIYDLLPSHFLHRRPYLVSAGRLDRWASGLLILSQNGESFMILHSPSGLLVEQLATPKRKKGVFGKVYEVKLLNPLQGNEERRFAAGDIKLISESTPCKPAKFEVKK